MRIERFGELEARVCGGTDGEGAGHGAVVVLLHGFGAPADDLVDLAHVLSVPQGTRFVFPAAPLRLDAWGSRAWWMIDPELFERRARGETVDRSEEQPAALPEVRAQMLELLDEVSERLGPGDDQLVLGGFSQGSMLALDVALHRASKPRALLLLSSTLIARSQWQPRMTSCADVQVFQSHGTHDPLLPFDAAETLRDLLRDAGARVQFVPFGGAHEIPAAVLGELSGFMTKVLAR